jgi:uncharacterized YccA/Bax inhibitor family protein
MKKAGTIIFIIGLLATVFTGFNFVTREKVIDIGELEIMANQNHELAWKPALGLAVMLVGGVVYAFGSKKIGPTLLSK